MLKCETSKVKNIRFGVAVSGIEARNLQGYFHLDIEGIGYQFAFTYRDNKIIVTIPALDTFIKTKLSLGQIIPVKLCVIVGNETQTPYADTMQIVKESINVEILSIQQESITSNESRVQDIIKAISESEYSTGIKQKAEKKKKDIKQKSTFFKNLWNNK